MTNLRRGGSKGYRGGNWTERVKTPSSNGVPGGPATCAVSFVRSFSSSAQQLTPGGGCFVTSLRSRAILFRDAGFIVVFKQLSSGQTTNAELLTSFKDPSAYSAYFHFFCFSPPHSIPALNNPSQLFPLKFRTRLALSKFLVLGPTYYIRF